MLLSKLSFFTPCVSFCETQEDKKTLFMTLQNTFSGDQTVRGVTNAAQSANLIISTDTVTIYIQSQCSARMQGLKSNIPVVKGEIKVYTSAIIASVRKKRIQPRCRSLRTEHN